MELIDNITCNKCGRLNRADYFYCSCGNDLEKNEGKPKPNKAEEKRQTNSLTDNLAHKALLLILSGLGVFLLGSYFGNTSASRKAEQQRLEAKRSNDLQIQKLQQEVAELKATPSKSQVVEKPVYTTQPSTKPPYVPYTPPKKTNCTTSYSYLSRGYDTNCTEY